MAKKNIIDMSQAPNKAQRSAEGQDNLLQTSTKEVARQAFFMKRAVDKNELKTVLKHAAGMLNELRTGLLLPKSYYDLYMRVCDELHVLESYFSDIVANGKSVVELYQQVQHWCVALILLFVHFCLLFFMYLFFVAPFAILSKMDIIL